MSISHISEKTQFPKKLEYSTSSERCATPWYVETSALRIYFYVRSVKLHFGEFSKLTFQAVSWSLLFSAPAVCFMMPVVETRDCCLLGDQTLLPVDRGHWSWLTEQTLYTLYTMSALYIICTLYRLHTMYTIYTMSTLYTTYRMYTMCPVCTR